MNVSGYVYIERRGDGCAGQKKHVRPAGTALGGERDFFIDDLLFPVHHID